MKIRMRLNSLGLHTDTHYGLAESWTLGENRSLFSLPYKLHVSSPVCRFVSDSRSHEKIPSFPEEKELFLKNHLGQNAHDKERSVLLE